MVWGKEYKETLGDIFRCSIGRFIGFPEADVEAVRSFFCTYQDFRTLAACARETGLSRRYCLAVKDHLYKNRMLGGYYFQARTPPQKFMREHILRTCADVSGDSLILEVGPGEHPVFPSGEYPNWHGVDKYYEGGAIRFRELEWAHRRYPEERVVRGGWENLSEALAGRGLVGRCDLVVGSHSYEHVTRPVRSLIEAARMLRPGGHLVLFVPDGFSDEPAARMEPTHTLYLVPDMIHELFDCAGVFETPTVETFRPNYDLVITAAKPS